MDLTVESTHDTLRNRKLAVLEAWARQAPTGAAGALLAQVLDELVQFVTGDDNAPESLASAVAAHVDDRFANGCTIESVVAEYSVLRGCIQTELRNRRFDHAVDIALAQAVKHYLALRERLRERFIGVLAHDLRSPLACVTMASESLLTQNLDERQSGVVEIVLDAGDRMRRMVDDILSWARNASSSEFPVAKREVNLAEILRAVAAETELEFGAGSLDLELHGDLRGNLDRDRIHQAINNLVRNAIEHGTGHAHVTARETGDGRTIVLSVTNRGALRPPTASDISEPFARRRHVSTSRGLGLYIVDQIVRAHGGSLDMTSTPADTTVTVRWPTGRGGDRYGW